MYTYKLLHARHPALLLVQVVAQHVAHLYLLGRRTKGKNIGKIQYIYIVVVFAVAIHAICQ